MLHWEGVRVAGFRGCLRGRRPVRLVAAGDPVRLRGTRQGAEPSVLLQRVSLAILHAGCCSVLVDAQIMATIHAAHIVRVTPFLCCTVCEQAACGGLLGRPAPRTALCSCRRCCWTRPCASTSSCSRRCGKKSRGPGGGRAVPPPSRRARVLPGGALLMVAAGWRGTRHFYASIVNRCVEAPRGNTCRTGARARATQSHAQGLVSAHHTTSWWAGAAGQRSMPT